MAKNMILPSVLTNQKIMSTNICVPCSTGRNFISRFGYNLDSSKYTDEHQYVAKAGITVEMKKKKNANVTTN